MNGKLLLNGTEVKRSDTFELPEEYQKKIKAIEDAQKDLQKFLIDHPEFIEVKNE